MENQNFTSSISIIIEGIKDYMGCGCNALEALKLYKLDLLDDLNLAINEGDDEAQEIVKYQLQLVREIESAGEDIIYCLEYLQAILEIDTGVVDDYMMGGDLL